MNAISHETVQRQAHVCSFRDVRIAAMDHSHSNRSRTFAGASQATQLIQVIPPQQVAHERLDDRIDFPFGPVFVSQQVLDATPARGAVVLTPFAFVKKFAMLLTHVFFVFLAVPDLHIPLLVPDSSRIEVT
jgi:hypothetical protein